MSSIGLVVLVDQVTRKVCGLNASGIVCPASDLRIADSAGLVVAGYCFARQYEL